MLLVFYMLALVTACGDSGDADSNVKIEDLTDLTVTVIVPAVDTTWDTGVAYEAEARCQERQVTYNMVYASTAEEMLAAFNQAAGQSADGSYNPAKDTAIVIYPQFEGLDTAIREAFTAGVNVVAFDCDLGTDDYCYVIGDNYALGTAAADYMLETAGTEGKVLILSATDGGDSGDARVQGFMDRLDEIQQNWTILTYATQTGRGVAETDFGAILGTEAELAGVYTTSDEIGIGVLAAIDNAGRTDIKTVIGCGGRQDYLAQIATHDSLEAACMLYSPRMVSYAVDMAIDLMQGKDVEPEYVVPATVINKDNVAEYQNSSAF